MLSTRPRAVLCRRRREPRSGLTVAATWDVELAERWGAGMGEEFRGKGANVQLGPSLGVARVPWAGLENFLKIPSPVIWPIELKGFLEDFQKFSSKSILFHRHRKNTMNSKGFCKFYSILNDGAPRKTLVL